MATHAPQLVPPSAQLSAPVPFATVQLRDPAGLEHACVSEPCAPQTDGSDGVQLCWVSGEPPQAGGPLGVQFWIPAGFAPPQKASATAFPRLSRQTTTRVCVPLEATQPQLALRVWLPLSAAKPQPVTVRACSPLPLQTAEAEQAPNAV